MNKLRNIIEAFFATESIFCHLVYFFATVYFLKPWSIMASFGKFGKASPCFWRPDWSSTDPTKAKAKKNKQMKCKCKHKHKCKYKYKHKYTQKTKFSPCGALRAYWQPDWPIKRIEPSPVWYIDCRYIETLEKYR